MNKTILIVLALIITSTSLFSQEHNFSPKNKDIPINFSYFGETIVHPGLSIGYEHHLTNQFISTLTIGTYLHPRNHRAGFVDLSINWRKSFRIGYSMEYGLGVGYLHTWEHGGKTYAVDDNGNVITKTKWGRPSVMPSIKLGILGWDFRNKANLPIRLNADLIIFGQYPFNNFVMPHLVTKIGVTYFFNNK